MTSPANEFTFRLEEDFSGRFWTIPLSVGQDIVIDLLPLPGRSASALSRKMTSTLLGTPHLRQLERNRYLMTNLNIKGNRVADLVIEASAGPSLIGVDGILGDNFFRQFASIRWDPHSNLITVVRA